VVISRFVIIKEREYKDGTGGVLMAGGRIWKKEHSHRITANLLASRTDYEIAALT